MQLFTELLNACWFSWGNFILAGCIDVDSSPLIYSELARAQDNLVLANELHLLYLVTPHDLRDSPQPEWMVYYKQVSGNSFWFSIESIIRLQYTLFDWLKYRAPPSQPIKCKTNGNRDLVGRVFPRWTQVTCVNFEFSLVPLDITLSSSWPFVITLVFPFRRAISKIALVEFYPLVVEIIKKKKLSVRHEERYVQCLSKTSLKPCARKKKTNLRWPAWKSFIEDSQLWSFRRQVSSFREESEERVAELLGATESFLFRRATGQRSKMVNGHLIELCRGVGSVSHSILFL